jgi:hypothetical protein
MNRVLVPLAVVVVLAGAIWLATQGSAPTPAGPNAPSSATSAAPASPAPAGKSDAPAAPAGPVVRTETQPDTVFQRAFWRRADATVRIRHAERREWVEGGTHVQRWEWFVVLEAKPEFRRWLLEQNPFELTRKPLPETLSLTGAPGWFPSRDRLAALATFANHEGRFVVGLDETTGQLFATDRGGGFNPSAVPVPAR